MASSGLVLARFIIVDFSPGLNDSFRLEKDDVTVKSNVNILDEKNNKTYSIVEATTALKNYPKRDRDNTIIIPGNVLNILDHSIENAIDLVSVSEFSSRSIMAPRKSIAFVANTKKAKDWLANTNGYHMNRSTNIAIDSHASIRIEAEIIAKLTDRIDGIKLIADALSQQAATGRFATYVRLFERAFALSFGLIKDPLNDFLDDTYGYTTSEMEKWDDLRGKIIHADVKSPEKFVYEKDILPIIGRVQQAAYDVLINKKIWHHKDTDRDNNWFPNTGTTSANRDLFLTQGLSAKYGAQLLDPFSDYRSTLIDVKPALDSAGRDYIWIEPFPDDHKQGGKFTVIAKREDSPSE
jgi:hypothetical protein